MHDMVPTVASSGASPVVRIAGFRGSEIKRALDAAAQCVCLTKSDFFRLMGRSGIIAPMISTAEDQLVFTVLPEVDTVTLSTEAQNSIHHRFIVGGLISGWVHLLLMRGVHGISGD